MSTKHLVIAGFAIGGLLGLTTGVAVGGDAYNGWWIFGLIGAFVGKLVARIDEQRAEQDQPVAGNAGAEHRSEKTSFVRAAVAILGTVWDAYVALLVHVGLGDFIDRRLGVSPGTGFGTDYMGWSKSVRVGPEPTIPNSQSLRSSIFETIRFGFADS